MDHYEVQPANVHTLAFQGVIRPPLEIWDQTLRDGEQTPGVTFSLEDKTEIARALVCAGVRYLNVGFPAVSSEEADTIRAVVDLELNAEVGVTARLNRGDIDAGVATGVRWINLFASPSDWHLQYKVRVSEKDYLATMVDVISYARGQGKKVALAIEDASRTQFERLARFVRVAVSEGVATIRICDTMGVLVPSASRELVLRLRELVPCTLLVHFHNDLGLATANTLMALEAGADGADVTVCGLGERTGNASLEQLAVALRVKYGCETGIDLGQLRRLAHQVAARAGVRIPRNEPITGELAFVHESGVHVAGLLANPTCYETFPPGLVRTAHKFVYGKHSGSAGVRHVLAEHGRAMTGDGERVLLQQIKAVAQRERRTIDEKEIVAWADALSGNESEQPNRSSS